MPKSVIPPTPDPVATTKPHSFVWTTTGGGALIVLGSFLPWISAITIFGTITKSGLDGGGDGIITLAIGALLVLLGLVSLSGVTSLRRWVTVGGASVMAALLTYELVELNKRIAGVVTGGFASINIGAGIWAMWIGAAVAFVGAFIGMGRKA